MTDRHAGAARPPAPSLVFLVTALVAGHTMAAMAALVLPAVAPEVARDFGFDPSLIGYQISILSVGMLISLALLSEFSRRLGATRTNQIGHGLVACGLLLITVPLVPFVVAGSFVVGLGYGMLTPSASYLLMRFTPLDRRNTVFSLHQVGIPLGGILAATLAPAIAVAVGWRWAMLLNAALIVAVIVLMQLGRAGWDDDRDPKARAFARNPFAVAVDAWRDRPIRLLSITAGCFSWAQFCAASFVVVACVQTLGMSLIVAGTVLMTVQISTAVGRVLAGWVADRAGSAVLVLAASAAALVAACLATLGLSPQWPIWGVYALFAVVGATSGSWPGALLAEVGKHAAPGRASAAISGSLIFTNIGKFVGPIVFANVYAATRSYGIAFASIALPAAVALACLLAARRHRPGHRPMDARHRHA
jgi:predicted MFS family arabinose efflux permease